MTITKRSRYINKGSQIVTIIDNKDSPPIKLTRRTVSEFFMFVLHPPLLAPLHYLFSHMYA